MNFSCEVYNKAFDTHLMFLCVFLYNGNNFCLFCSTIWIGKYLIAWHAVERTLFFGCLFGIFLWVVGTCCLFSLSLSPFLFVFFLSCLSFSDFFFLSFHIVLFDFIFWINYMVLNRSVSNFLCALKLYSISVSLCTRNACLYCSSSSFRTANNVYILISF